MEVLPEKPEGFTRRMTMHLNFGSEGGLGTYECFYPNGDKAEFWYQYDTRKGGLTGFCLPGDDERAMTWAELREELPKWKAARAGGE